MCAWWGVTHTYLWRPEQCVRSHGARVAGSCELLGVGANTTPNSSITAGHDPHQETTSPSTYLSSLVKLFNFRVEKQNLHPNANLSLTKLQRQCPVWKKVGET